MGLRVGIGPFEIWDAIGVREVLAATGKRGASTD
jgi:hypothetical protein